MFKGVLFNLCPECREGKVFRGLYSMNDRCTVCSLQFEREAGYFLGAMMVGYFIGALALLPTVILGLWVYHIGFGPLMVVATAQVVFMNPIIFRLSRLTWIHAEYRITRRLA
jgi:uncharacterized protein (DUF983 family)